MASLLSLSWKTAGSHWIVVNVVNSGNVNESTTDDRRQTTSDTLGCRNAKMGLLCHSIALSLKGRELTGRRELTGPQFVPPVSHSFTSPRLCRCAFDTHTYLEVHTYLSYLLRMYLPNVCMYSVHGVGT